MLKESWNKFFLNVIYNEKVVFIHLGFLNLVIFRIKFLRMDHCGWRIRGKMVFVADVRESQPFLIIDYNLQVLPTCN